MPLSPFEQRAGGSRDAVLDGLRAVAALAVVASHAVLLRFGVFFGEFAPLLREQAPWVGMAGVKAFFLISGYVITRLLLNEQRERGRIGLGEFYIRRLTRIVPAFFVYLCAIFVLSHRGHFYVAPGEFIAAGAFVCDTPLYPCGWFVGHSWTLAVEEQFYLLWPMLLVFVRPRMLAPLLVAAAVVLLAIAFHRGGSPFNLEAALLCIVLGVLVAVSFRLQRHLVSGIRAPAWTAAATGLAVAWLLLPRMATVVVEPALLTILVFGAANVRALSAILKSWPFQAIGACSYSLYLWQELFFGLPFSYFGPPPPLWALPVVVWLSWQFVEKPGRALGRIWVARAGGSERREGRLA